MKVKILLNLPKTIDGKSIGPFTAGQVCDLDDDLAEIFIGSTMAVEYTGPEPEPVAAVRAPKVSASPTSGADEAERAAAEGAARAARRKAD